MAVRRDWQLKNAAENEEKSHVRHFLTSLDPAEKQRIPAAVRNALLAIIPFCVGEPLSSWLEIYQRHPAKAIQLIFHAAPIKPNALSDPWKFEIFSVKQHLDNVLCEIAGSLDR